MKVGWKTQEVIGVSVINPIIYVYEIIKRNTINKNNLSEIIKICLSYVPHRKERVLDIIEENYPELKFEIDKFRMLL